MLRIVTHLQKSLIDVSGKKPSKYLHDNFKLQWRTSTVCWVSDVRLSCMVSMKGTSSLSWSGERFSSGKWLGTQESSGLSKSSNVSSGLDIIFWKERSKKLNITNLWTGNNCVLYLNDSTEQGQGTSLFTYIVNTHIMLIWILCLIRIFKNSLPTCNCTLFENVSVNGDQWPR